MLGAQPTGARLRQAAERLSYHPATGQLLKIILAANSTAKPTPGPMTSSLTVDTNAVAPNEPIPVTVYDPAALLRPIGLLDVVDQTLQIGPSEDTIAQITHAMRQPGAIADGQARQQQQSASLGNGPLVPNRKVIDAVVAYIGSFAVARARNAGGNAAATSAGPPDSSMSSASALFSPGSTDVRTLRLLAVEAHIDVRYFLCVSITNHLRHVGSSLTHYFMRVALDVFTHEPLDPQQGVLRQQMVRVLMERLLGPAMRPATQPATRPWGLQTMLVELTKSEKYYFFELPSLQLAPDVRQAFEDTVLNPPAAI